MDTSTIGIRTRERRYLNQYLATRRLATSWRNAFSKCSAMMPRVANAPKGAPRPRAKEDDTTQRPQARELPYALPRRVWGPRRHSAMRCPLPQSTVVGRRWRVSPTRCPPCAGAQTLLWRTRRPALQKGHPPSSLPQTTDELAADAKTALLAPDDHIPCGFVKVFCDRL